MAARTDSLCGARIVLTAWASCDEARADAGARRAYDTWSLDALVGVDGQKL